MYTLNHTNDTPFKVSRKLKVSYKRGDPFHFLASLQFDLHASLYSKLFLSQTGYEVFGE